MSLLADIVGRNLAGQGGGIPSWCTAHPETIGAILQGYTDDDAPILIEATCNQVNQFGGYTGQTPMAFADWMTAMLKVSRIDPGRLILGGDHLGPNPWRNEPAAEAMQKAQAMVAEYVRAGFTKIHLDASMACADDAALTDEQMASRAADLAVVAEKWAGTRALCYVIGTEVPVPGGETERLDTLAVTRPEAVRRTVDLHRAAFAGRGLGSVMDRVIGVVVQPGVDFGNDQVFAYDPDRSAALVAAAPTLGGPAFEAHSTDYQSGAALAALVRDHFAVLKVGPELTFAYRQAAFAMADLAAMTGQPDLLRPALCTAMQDDPANWRPYVEAGPREQAMMLYGLSDRVRYYWRAPVVQQALHATVAYVRSHRAEPGLVAQVTGGLVADCAPDDLPETIVRRMVGAVVAKYRIATGA